MLRRYWNSGTYARMSIPNFSAIMPHIDFIEIRRNLRFEDYRRENELSPTDKASDKNRTKYKCVQCSSVALKPSDTIYLHPECFGEYHRRKYRTVLGSSNVKGLVIGT